MIRDARGLDAGTTLDFDVCVVGGGAAGITLAIELERTGARICVLEAGGLSYEPGAQAFLDGDVTGDAYPPLTDTRLSALGGSTKLWAGWCRPFDDMDFVDRPWVANSGWPFGRDALVPFYRRAHEICGLADFEYDPVAWEGRGSGSRLPIPDADLTTSIFQVSPTDFGRAHQGVLEGAGSVHILLHAVALRLRRADAGELVEAVEVATPGGGRFEVRARSFVLAAGGVENPRLLLMSGASPDRGIGNGNGLVGRYFSDHPFLTPGAFVAAAPAPPLRFYFPTGTASNGGAREGASVRAALSLSPAALERDRVLNGALFFRPAYEAHPAFATPEVQALLRFWEPFRGRGAPGHRLADLRRALRAPHRIAAATWRRLTVSEEGSTRWPIRAFFECESRESNRVQLSDRRDSLGRLLPRIEWRLSDLDIRSIQNGWRTLDRALRQAGLGRLELGFPDQADAWRSACEGGKHHMGTTRMHVDPRRGVVDADCRVHGTANLYIAGSSVFPTPGFANPTLTIVALTARLAALLASRLR